MLGGLKEPVPIPVCTESRGAETDGVDGCMSFVCEYCMRDFCYLNRYGVYVLFLFIFRLFLVWHMENGARGRGEDFEGLEDGRPRPTS